MSSSLEKTPTFLILLLYYSADQTSSYKLLYKSERETNSIHDIYQYRDILGVEVCKTLLFIHAFGGCDTTSQFFGIGKGATYTKLRKSTELFSLSKTFSSQYATYDEVKKAGERAASILYGGNKDEKINVLRKKLLGKKVAKAKTFVKPEKLPPTEDSLFYHSQRVHYQIMKWHGNNSIDAEKWGWRLHDGRLSPITTMRNPAPDNLLKVIACNCTGDCSSMNCGCRRGGYPCTYMCGKCQLNECTNANFPIEDDEENDG